MHLILADVYLANRRDTGRLYSESYNAVAVMFASIPDYIDFYTDNDLHHGGGGIICLKILNEIIASFDKVMLISVIERKKYCFIRYDKRFNLLNERCK